MQKCLECGLNTVLSFCTLDCPSVIHSLFTVVHSCDCGAVNTSIVTAFMITSSYLDCHFLSNSRTMTMACTKLHIDLTFKFCVHGHYRREMGLLISQ